MLFRSATSRQSRPATTVAADATMAALRSAAQRGHHRDPDVLVVVQSLPIPRDEQQRVVRADAEHLDRPFRSRSAARVAAVTTSGSDRVRAIWSRVVCRRRAATVCRCRPGAAGTRLHICRSENATARTRAVRQA
jgi:hypothetical protein